MVPRAQIGILLGDYSASSIHRISAFRGRPLLVDRVTTRVVARMIWSLVPVTWFFDPRPQDTAGVEVELGQRVTAAGLGRVADAHLELEGGRPRARDRAACEDGIAETKTLDKIKLGGEIDVSVARLAYMLHVFFINRAALHLPAAFSFAREPREAAAGG